MRMAACTLCALGLAACGGPSAADLQGTWLLDAGSFDRFEEIRELNEAQRRMLQALAERLGTVKLTISADKLVFEMGQQGGSEQSYRVVRTEGSTFTLEVKSPSGRTDKVHVTLDGDRLLVDLSGQMMPFRRA